VGGIGTYGVQISAALGAKVIALDIDDARLDRIKSFGAGAVVNVKGLELRQVRDAVRAAAKQMGASPHRWKVFEMSGTGAGQSTAYELLTFGGTVGFIGFSLDKVSVRLGNLMAFDATLFGNWGCLPELYPAATEMVRQGRIQTRPFTRKFSLEQINEVIARSIAHELVERPVLVP
jgi:6-hydroxycyclohex-1-ene-1-carbonyl-CoA dehydrogenase